MTTGAWIRQADDLTLDFSRMELPEDLAEQLQGPIQRAVRHLRDVEAGLEVNTDEGRKVGHYWLRDPELGEPDVAAEIRKSWKSIESFARQFEAGPWKQVLWIGIGGSGLGPQLLRGALERPGETPAMYFLDNTDPSGFDHVYRQLQVTGTWKETLTVVVSKSGGTRETHNGLTITQRQYAAHELGFEANAVAITLPGSKLDQLATGKTGGAKWAATLPLWDWVGGRTSIFSAVGLLPAALLNFEMREFIEGARALDANTRQESIHENAALQLAAAWYYWVEVKQRRNMVILPYCDRLELFGKYLQQLVMESLGKQGKGITVLGNKGSTDQHSYVQQLRDGTADFFVTFLRELVPPHDYEVEPGVTVGDYLCAFQEGTARALSEAGRPSLRISFHQLNERVLGQLIAIYERAVGYFGAMIELNPYHQPGVEAGKKAANSVIDLQQRVVVHLRQHPGETWSCDQLATACDGDAELIEDLLRRLVLNHRAGLEQVADGFRMP